MTLPAAAQDWHWCFKCKAPYRAEDVVCYSQSGTGDPPSYLCRWHWHRLYGYPAAVSA